MLQQEVVDAVRDGKFHVWAVKTVDEGMELLTGVKSGSLNSDGEFEPGTVNHKVQDRMLELATIMERFGSEEEDQNQRDDDTIRTHQHVE